MDAEQLRVLKLAIDCIEDAIEAGGIWGAPSGIVYAGLSSRGMRFQTYESIINAMVSQNMIIVDESHCLKFTPARLVARAEARAAAQVGANWG